jgi:hypothetical protein
MFTEIGSSGVDTPVRIREVRISTRKPDIVNEGVLEPQEDNSGITP